MRKKRLICLVVLTALVVLAVIGLDQRLIVRTYTVESDRIDAPVRLAVLTDYHGCDYGPNGAVLVLRLNEHQPDAILLVGDIFSADSNPDEELTFLRALAVQVPTFYVTGNHEYWEYDVPALETRITAAGVTVLDQNCAELTVNGQVVNLCGVPDPCANVNTESALRHAAEDIQQDSFTVLLAHRPELIEQYATHGSFDLVVSGHAHGGQVRFPLLVNGLYAPNQGWFPKYAGGRYEVGGTTLIVSRGLSDQRQMGIPRIFNRPELVMVEIQPASP